MVNCNSVIYRVIYSQHKAKSKNLIFTIAGHCRQFSLAKELITQADLQKVLTQPTEQIIDALDQMMTQSEFCAQIHTLAIDQSMVSFESSQFKMGTKDCQRIVNGLDEVPKPNADDETEDKVAE